MLQRGSLPLHPISTFDVRLLIGCKRLYHCRTSQDTRPNLGFGGSQGETRLWWYGYIALGWKPRIYDVKPSTIIFARLVTWPLRIDYLNTSIATSSQIQQSGRADIPIKSFLIHGIFQLEGQSSELGQVLCIGIDKSIGQIARYNNP